MFRLLILLIFCFSCGKVDNKKKSSIYDYPGNELTGSPLMIEILKNNKPSIKIQSDTLYKYNNGNILMIGGVYADLFDEEGIKTSEMHSDSATVYSNSDSVRANGDIMVKSVKGYELLTSEILLYNDTKLVHSNKNVLFTSSNKDTLYGTGFWSNFDMTNSKVKNPTGVINNK